MFLFSCFMLVVVGFVFIFALVLVELWHHIKYRKALQIPTVLTHTQLKPPHSHQPPPLALYTIIFSHIISFRFVELCALVSLPFIHLIYNRKTRNKRQTHAHAHAPLTHTYNPLLRKSTHFRRFSRHISLQLAINKVRFHACLSSMCW